MAANCSITPQDATDTLRNQIKHGGATWNSSVNQDQLHDCANLLGKRVPVIILLMLDNPEALWGGCLLSVCCLAR